MGEKLHFGSLTMSKQWTTVASQEKIILGHNFSVFETKHLRDSCFLFLPSHIERHRVGFPTPLTSLSYVLFIHNMLISRHSHLVGTCEKLVKINEHILLKSLY